MSDKCCHCGFVLRAYRVYRTNYSHGRKSRPKHILNKINYVCLNKECQYRIKNKKKYRFSEKIR